MSVKIILALLIMFNFGCTYQQVSPKGTMEIHFSQKNEESFYSAFKEFAHEKELAFNNGTREYPSGAKSILFELTTKDGKKVLKVNDYMDETRFVVSVFENDKRDWRPLFESCFEFLRDRFPDAKFEVTLADS